MKTLIRSASGLAILSLFAIAHASPPTVNPEPMDLDVDITAKILKEKSRRNSVGEAGGSNVASSKDCGSVNINSSNNNDKKSISGLQDMFGKQSTTIVTGPVINMANCK
jgi:hypothetical protein